VKSSNEDAKEVYARRLEGGSVVYWDWDSEDDELHYENQYDYDDHSTGYFYSGYAGIWDVHVTGYSEGSNDTAENLFYVSEVDSVAHWWYYAGSWYMDDGTQYIALDGSISLCANSNPPGYPYDVAYFPSGSPTWQVTDQEHLTLDESNSGFCYGGSQQDQLTISDFPAAGIYTVAARAGSLDSGDNIDVVVFDTGISANEEYVAYATATDFDYEIRPHNGWYPDHVYFWIENEAGYTIYGEDDEDDFTNRAKDIPGSGTIDWWDGKDNSDEWLEPGTYYAWIYVEKENEWGTQWYQACDEFTVYKVTAVQWETYWWDNIDIDDSPAPYQNNGKRIFPGKKTYDEDSLYAARRKKVYVRATISPEIEGAKVYFTAWDVDDPSSTDPDGSTDTSGRDNYGSGFELLTTFGMSNSSGIASNILIVSMQPGDNFRVAASADQDSVLEYDAATCPEGKMTQEIADDPTSNPPPDGVELTSMLTVWRHLWIEQDSMGAVASSGDEKNFISGTAYAYHQDSQDDVILGEEIEFDSAFCGGGSGENDDNFEDGFYYVSGYDPYDIVSNHFAHSTLGTPHNPVHNLVVDGHPSTDGGSGQPISLDYDCYDDDYRIDGGNIVPYITLPCNDSLDSYELKFNPAYIKPTHLTEYEDEITFYRNYNSYFVAYGLGSWDLVIEIQQHMNLFIPDVVQDIVAMKAVYLTIQVVYFAMNV
ncbi:MAG: hypothetical protein P8Y60_16340, partial [Calditrichota bacterium]